ncbi:hypothetical protein NDN01_07595 [Sphingomonas sp. QA11]|uniref:hypothetical protein n=1 Tax=Sphingomonas sp. QA11 TaxID=2950605 RepID=UPI00234A9B1F|nr:hypothetical protein [Sphingomonas sp. QA11]WCM28760.1 hypothetical protein NDN01_07595 [Sphingomonas sp. QA11]
MNITDMPDTEPKPKLLWTAPKLETLGDMNDTMLSVMQPPSDGSLSPTRIPS